MMDGPNVRQVFSDALKIANGDEVDIGKITVELAQSGFVGMMNGIHHRLFHEARMGETGRIVQVDQVTIALRIGYRPRRVVDVLEVGMYLTADRPLTLLV